ncbi:MAG: GNAT family N-acetyltransferase [Pyrinomonadaceae bacterium]
MSNQQIQIVPYSEDFAEAHCEFAARMWPNKRRRREGTYQRWKFRGPAQGPLDGLLLAVEDGIVLGQLGLIPAVLRVGKNSYPCQWACDLMVDSSLRRKGVGTLLLKAAMARPVVTLGSNPSPAADITMSRLGFKPLTGPRIMILPRQLNEVLAWVMPPSLKKAIPLVSIVGRPIAAFRSRALIKKAGTEVVTESTWEEILRLIEARQSTIDSPHVLHDYQFMAWRCSGLDGYTAKLEAIQVDGGFAVIGPAKHCYYVYEWGAGSKGDFLALFRAIYRRAARAKCQTIEVLAHGPQEEQWLREVRFIGMRTRFKVICYPPERLIPRYDKFYYCIYDSDGNL